jgi:hypothetical protein
MDKGKLAYISSLRYGEQVIVQALNEETPLTLEQLAMVLVSKMCSLNPKISPL